MTIVGLSLLAQFKGLLALPYIINAPRTYPHRLLLCTPMTYPWLGSKKKLHHLGNQQATQASRKHQKFRINA